MSVRTRVIRKSKSRRLESEYERNAKQVVARAAALVHATAVQSITDGNKSGETYEKYNPRRTHRASAAGEPPAADTGYLHSNIFMDIDSDGLGASVESRAEYSAYLEFGTADLAARPFMQPAVEANRRAIRDLAVRMMRTRSR